MTKPDPFFMCEYSLDGDKWCVSLQAKDWDDAQRKLDQINRFGLVLVGKELDAVKGLRGDNWLAPRLLDLKMWVKTLRFQVSTRKDRYNGLVSLLRFFHRAVSFFGSLDFSSPGRHLPKKWVRYCLKEREASPSN